MADAKMTPDSAIKLQRLRAWMEEKEVEGVLLTSLASFSWLTAGRGHIGLAAEQGCGKILVTKQAAYLLINNIEAERILQEETRDPFWEVKSFPWWEPAKEATLRQELLQGAAWIEEKEAAGEIARLRWELTDMEIERYRVAGRAVAEALEQTCFDVRQGESELEIAARLAANCLQRGIDPVLQLVAVDERTTQYRHPLPTNKKLDRYAMMVVGGRSNGLVVSVTRCVHLGPVPAEMLTKHQHVAQLDAELILQTRPGQVVGDIFQRLCNGYQTLGYPNEWNFHHQGGLTGYLSREFRATADSKEIVQAKQAYAWNPSIRGVKSEDTFLVGETGNELLTETGHWPSLEFELQRQSIKRPGILVL